LPIRDNYGQIHYQMCSGTHQSLDAENICDVDMSGGIECSGGMIGRDGTTQLRLVRITSVEGGIDRELVFADRDDPNLRCTFFA
jgi:hypothetical protein